MTESCTGSGCSGMETYKKIIGPDSSLVSTEGERFRDVSDSTRKR